MEETMLMEQHLTFMIPESGTPKVQSDSDNVKGVLRDRKSWCEVLPHRSSNNTLQVTLGTSEVLSATGRSRVHWIGGACLSSKLSAILLTHVASLLSSQQNINASKQPAHVLSSWEGQCGRGTAPSLLRAGHVGRTCGSGWLDGESSTSKDVCFQNVFSRAFSRWPRKNLAGFTTKQANQRATRRVAGSSVCWFSAQLSREALTNCKSIVCDSKIEADATLQTAIKESLREAATAFVIGECVHILNSEKEQLKKRRRVNDSTDLLSSVVLEEEGAFDKTLDYQLNKARVI